MSTRRPGTLRSGDRIRFDGGTYLVLRIVGTLVVLAQEFRRGEELAVHLADLQAAAGNAAGWAPPQSSLAEHPRLRGERAC